MMTAVWLLAMASYARSELLVSTEWLSAHLDDPNVRIVDTRTRGYEEAHIPGAVHLDIDASRDPANPPTFLPDLDTFVATLEELGISNDTHIVLYDDRGGIYGTRPWVLLRVIGHERVSIVNGGWRKWTSESRATTEARPRPERGSITVDLDESWIVTADEVEDAIDADGLRIVDTRTSAEHDGSDSRNNPRQGAIPSSILLNWEETVAGDHMTFKSPEALTELFASRGLTPDESVITYCQAAGRAAHELFVLYLMGYDDVRLYMGSMEDWSRQPSRPLQ